MQRLAIALFSVVLLIGSLFLFWSPEPTKRKQRRALPQVPVAKMVEPELPEPKIEAEEEEAPLPQDDFISDDVTSQLASDQTDLTFEQGYCEPKEDPLESQWLRDVRDAMTGGSPDKETLEALTDRFEDLEDPLPRDMLAQSIILRQIGNLKAAQSVYDALPEPQPANLNRMVEIAKTLYQSGRFAEAVSTLQTHQKWSLAKVLYLPFLARVSLTDELTSGSAIRRGDGYQLIVPSEAEFKDWGTWQEGVDIGLDALSDFIEGDLPEPLTIVVFKDRSELLATTCGKNWAGGIYDGIIKLFMGEDGSLPSIRTLQHELVHASLSRNYKHRPPMWFEEGLAELFEHRDKPIDPAFESIVANRVYVPLTTLSDGFHLLEAGEEASAAYQQSRLLMLWLQRDNGPMNIDDALALLNGPPLQRDDFISRVLGADFSMETYFQFIQTLGVPK